MLSIWCKVYTVNINKTHSLPEAIHVFATLQLAPPNLARNALRRVDFVDLLVQLVPRIVSYLRDHGLVRFDRFGNGAERLRYCCRSRLVTHQVRVREQLPLHVNVDDALERALLVLAFQLVYLLNFMAVVHVDLLFRDALWRFDLLW